MAARVGQPRRRAASQIHREDVGIAVVAQQAHDHLLAVRREARREGHAGEIADQFALPGLDLQQIDLRLAALIGHVGDFLARRREARRQRDRPAVREIAHAGAVLVHDGEPLLALVLRPGLVDEDDARVEIALLAGQPLIDGVGDDVGDAARIGLVGEELLADQLLAGERVPQPELGAQPPVGLLGDAAGDQRLRVDDLPVLEARRGIGVADLLDEGALVDRREQAGALEVGGDDRRRSRRRCRRPTGSR